MLPATMSVTLLRAELDALLERLANGLRNLPGATELHLCGSFAASQADAYSDLDLEIFTVDAPGTRRLWPHFLERIGPVELCWPLRTTPDNAAYAVLFRGVSYYHKVDIGLAAPGDLLAAPSLRLWSQPPPVDRHDAIPTEAYRPAPGTVGHALLGDLIAGVRYVKARKRGQLLTCWRFLKQWPGRMLELLDRRARVWQTPAELLSTWDYVRLDSSLDAATRDAILEHIDWSEPRVMDQSFGWFVERATELYLDQARALGELVPAALVDGHLAFFRTELEL
jgi:hypothetical protein